MTGMKFTSHLALGLAAAAVFLMAPSVRAQSGALSPEDEDRQWMAPTLADRHSLFEDAREMANKISNPSARNVTLAKVIMSEAKAADATGREKLQKEAMDLLIGMTADLGRLAYAQVLLDIADGNGPQASDKTRILQARDRLQQLRKDMGARRDADFDFFDTKKPNDNYNTYMAAFYQEARSYMLLAKTEAPRSKERSVWVEEVGKVIQDMQFEQLHWTLSEFDSYILNGDARVVEGEYLSAVDKYLELPAALSSEDRSHPLVREQSLRGYLKAMETLTTVLVSDPQSPQRVRREVANAFEAFPNARATPQGKELLIYDTAASIRLGGDTATALGLLNGLVSDADPSLRRKAARQLAELAGNPRLNNAQRLECAKRVGSVSEYDVMLLAVQSLHGLLAGISNVQDFEAYAPYCYAMIGSTYERMHRFMDAATVFREGANRFRYWRDNNPEWDSSTEALAGHFFNRGRPNCEVEAGTFVVRLMTKGDAFNYSRILAARALDNARYMASRNHGDDKNAAFADFAREMDTWYVPFAGEDQKFSVVKKRGYDLFTEGKTNPARRIESAAYLLSTPAADRTAAVTTSYFAGTALVLAYSAPGPIPNVPANLAENVSRDAFFLNGYTLLGLKFDSQLARADSDFDRLPVSLRNELKALIGQLAGPSAATDPGKYWWVYAQYALKRAIMLQLNTDAARIAALENAGQLTIASAFEAYCDGANAAFLNRAPAERQASPAMTQMAKVVLQLVWALGNPKLNIADPAQKQAAEAELAATCKDEVRELLRNAWRNLAPHVEAAMSGAEGSEKTSLDTLMRTMITGLFREMVDAGRSAEATEAFEAYRAMYAADNPSAESEAGKVLRSMAAELFNTLVRYERPKADALRVAADRLDIMGVQLGKPDVVNLFAAAAHFESSGAQAKVKDFAKLASAERTALVLEAWEKLDSATRREATARYIHDRIVDNIFGPDASIRLSTSSGESELKFAGLIPGGELPAFTAFWEAARPKYDALVQQAAVKALESRRADGAAMLSSAKSDNTLALKLVDEAIALAKDGKVDAALARLDDAVRPSRPDEKDRKAPKDVYGDVGVTVVSGARIGLAATMGDLGFGDGHAFHAELRLYLEARAVVLRNEARAPMRRFLEGNERLRSVRGEPLYTAGTAMDMGDLLSAVGDWESAMKAWKVYFDSREAVYGDVSHIPVVAERFEHTNDAERAEEVRVRLELARATFEVAKGEQSAQKRFAMMNEALHHARRVYAIMQWRDGVEADKEGQWKRNLANSRFLGPQIDRSYIPALRLYAELLETFADGGLRPDWKAKYYAQSFGALSKDAAEKLEESRRFFVLPTDPAAMYADAAMCHYMLRAFGELPGGFYNQFYRDSFPKWGRLKLKEAAAHQKAGKADLADAAAGMVARFVWAEWNNKRGAAWDDASKAYVAGLRTLYEDARKVVTLKWMQDNARAVLDAELAASGAGGTPAKPPEEKKPE